MIVTMNELTPGDVVVMNGDERVPMWLVVSLSRDANFHPNLIHVTWVTLADHHVWRDVWSCAYAKYTTAEIL